MCQSSGVFLRLKGGAPYTGVSAPLSWEFGGQCHVSVLWSPALADLFVNRIQAKPAVFLAILQSEGRFVEILCNP